MKSTAGPLKQNEIQSQFWAEKIKFEHLQVDVYILSHHPLLLLWLCIEKKSLLGHDPHDLIHISVLAWDKYETRNTMFSPLTVKGAKGDYLGADGNTETSL